MQMSQVDVLFQSDMYRLIIRMITKQRGSLLEQRVRLERCGPLSHQNRVLFEKLRKAFANDAPHAEGLAMSRAGAYLREDPPKGELYYALLDEYWRQCQWYNSYGIAIPMSKKFKDALMLAKLQYA